MNCANNYVLNIKKLHTDSQLPTLGSAHAAGYDLYAYLNDEYSVSPRRITIKTIKPSRSEQELLPLFRMDISAPSSRDLAWPLSRGFVRPTV